MTAYDRWCPRPVDGPRRSCCAGFTLIELMVTLAILGTLLGIATRNSQQQALRARDAALQVTLGQLRSAVARYILDHAGQHPPDLAAMAGTQLRQVPQRWQGANGAGAFGYDPATGDVRLCEDDGRTPSAVLDARGQPYGQY